VRGSISDPIGEFSAFPNPMAHTERAHCPIQNSTTPLSAIINFPPFMPQVSPPSSHSCLQLCTTTVILQQNWHLILQHCS